MNEQTIVRDEEPEENGLAAYLPSIIWQRRWWIATPLVIGSIGGIAAAFLIPPKYESAATLLVESPQLPAELTGTTFASVIDKRVARIRQQVLSRPDLIELIENNNLYSTERGSKPLSTLIEQMRDATTIAPVNADIGGSPNQPGANTIAFTLSFRYPDAQKAQVVAQDFVERLVKLDAAQSSQQATSAVRFLEDQSNGLSTQISALERQIQTIKAQNGMALSTSGMMMMPGGGGGYDAQIAQLQRDNSDLSAQLSLQSSAAGRDPAVVAAEAALAGARAVYTDTHPDVRLAEQRLAEAKRMASRTARQTSNVSSIQSQIAANRSAIAQLQAAKNSERSQSSAIMSAQSKAPVVAEQIAQLESRADGLRTNYQTVQTNLMNARGAAKLESQQKGERLSVVDPPVVAEEPSWPNRPLLILGGIIGGAGLGLMFALLAELVLRPVRGVGAIQRITGSPPLVTVPIINGDRDGGSNGGSWMPWRRNDRSAKPRALAG